MPRWAGWTFIVRLGLVQASIGAMAMLATSLLNRVMVVEYGVSAAVPAGLVAWHYAVQLSRPAWGHSSDRGGRRTPWIMAGMAILALGEIMAVKAATMLGTGGWEATALAIAAFTLIGAGVGAAGTSMLAMLATGVEPERRAAAAAVTWIMMVAGIAVSAGIAGSLLQPFSPSRLMEVSAGVVGAAFLIAVLAVIGLERRIIAGATSEPQHKPDFIAGVREILRDREASRFTLFIFVSMLAYSMQDLILEPFAGLAFGFTPGQSTELSGLQHAGVLTGMLAAGIGGSAFAGRLPGELRHWIMAGCLGSALALAGLAIAAWVGPGWPLALNIFALGTCNGIFAVAAIGAMMGLAGKGQEAGEGVRIGVWGAAQAIAFGLGGLTGAVGVDLLRHVDGGSASAFGVVFASEACLFVLAIALLSAPAANERVALNAASAA